MTDLAGIQVNVSGNKTFIATAAAILPFRLVKLSSGNVVYAAAGDEDILGSTGELSAAASGPVDVRLANAPGTRMLTAGGAIAAGAVIMPTTAGKALTHDGSQTRGCGFALTAAGADGDVFEAFLYPSTTSDEAAMLARIVAIEGGRSLTLPAATGNIVAKTIVSPTLDTVWKWGYGSTSALGPLFFSILGATAAADCIAVEWQSKASHVCTATAAAILKGEKVVLTANGQIVKISAGAGKVVIGTCSVAVGAGGGDCTVIPCAPYVTVA